MPVSWQIGRWPSAHMRELVRICAIASFAAGRLLALVGAAQRADVVERVVVGDELQRVGDALDQVSRSWMTAGIGVLEGLRKPRNRA